MKNRTLLIACALAVSAHTHAGGNEPPRSASTKTTATAPTKPYGGGQVQAHATRSAELCQRQECVLEVTVDKCVVQVTPYVIVMTGRAPVKMVWRIRGGEFAANPIRFKEPEARKVFERASASPREVVFDNNKRNGIWHYGIKVTDGGKECPELDPTGVNDWGAAGDPPP